MREDGGGDAAARLFFLKQTDGEHMRWKCVVSSVSEGFLIDFCPSVALFMISTLIWIFFAYAFAIETNLFVFTMFLCFVHKRTFNDE